MGPYQAKPNGVISYFGNKIYGPIENVLKVNWPPKDLAQRVESISQDKKMVSFTQN